MESNITLVLVLIVTLGIGAQWVAWRIKVPAIILLSILGVVFGPVMGVIQPEQAFGELFRPIIGLCVAIILFDGGLSLRLHELSEAGQGVRRLVFPGAPLAWVIYSLAAHYIGGLSWPVSLVFGAIIVVTGPTVIIPMLRQAGLKKRVGNIIKWEGIVNDPLGALLAVLVFEYFVFTGGGAPAVEVIRNFLAAIFVSGGMGVAAAFLVGWAFPRGYVPEYLKPPVVIALVLLVFSLSNAVQAESGLLAATLFGVILGERDLPSIEELRRFKEYVAVFLVSIVFILLSASIDFEIMAQLDWRAGVLLAAIMVLARPVAVLLSMYKSDVPVNERMLVAWVAPRGIVAAAVAGFFAPAMIDAGYAEAELLVPLMFSLIFVTVAVNGGTVRWFAAKLDLAVSHRNGLLIVGASAWSTELARVLKDLGCSVTVADASWHRLKLLRMAGLNYFYGQVISESAHQRLDLTETGYLLAATDNDAYNALVCSGFANELGRDRVKQLPMTFGDEQDPKGYHRTIRGATVFDENSIYDDLLEKFYQGWRYQKTRITETYDSTRYFAEVPQGAVQLLMIRADGSLVFNTQKHPLQPKLGDTVIALMPPRHPKRKKDKDAAQAKPVSDAVGNGNALDSI